MRKPRPLNEDTLKRAKTKQFNHALRRTVLTLLWFTLIHACGIYLFTKGFLLTRLVLEDKSSCSDFNTGGLHAGNCEKGCWHPKRFEKAVIVVIDALRYDFVEPQSHDLLFCHNALTLPHKLSVESPQQSVLYRFIADPPTTTLQRLKGLTTGTLPTFVDAGSNFGGTEIKEDNFISQLATAGKIIGFMGDDTWVSLFPESFDPNMTWPFESFNVWDLHTLDNGVNAHLFEHLKDQSWDVTIAHYLGVDHAGHRYGPNHPEMAAKLKEMDQNLVRIVEHIDERTLLIVMGDHGMDAKGDHGGDSPGELEAALWLYSNRPMFGHHPSQPSIGRAIAQIDLVPTLSLLLGMPIPYNSLGSPIAEAFIDPTDKSYENLARVSKLTAYQVSRYQESYASSHRGEVGGLSGKSSLISAMSQFDQGEEGKLDWLSVHASFAEYQSITLSNYRSIWAKFDPMSMLGGIMIICFSVICLVILGHNLSGDFTEVAEILAVEVFKMGIIGAGFGFCIAVLSSQLQLLTGVTVGFVIGSLIAFARSVILFRQRLTFRFMASCWDYQSLIFTTCHAALFASNSYTVWEDRFLTFTLCSFGISALVSSLRLKSMAPRIFTSTYSIGFLLMTRLASYSRLCREEQMPYCQSTFYASSSSSVSAPSTLFLLGFAALSVPSLIRSFFQTSRSYVGAAPLWIGFGLRVCLLLNALYWALDGAENGGWLNVQNGFLLTQSKLVIAKIILGMALVAGNIGWARGSYCIEIDTNTPAAHSERSTVLILGYGNAYGSTMFLYLCNLFVALALLQKPMGALSFDILLIQMLCLVDIVDQTSMSASAIGPVILAMLGNSHFFSSGHQATIPSIQWESAFIPMTTIIYPFSPLLVVANTFGPQFFTACSVSLISLWKKAPKSEGLLSGAAKAGLSFILYQTAVTLSSMVFAAWFRRHLMVWKVFAPRFMLGAVVLLLVDVGVTFGSIGFGAGWTVRSVSNLFGF